MQNIRKVPCTELIIPQKTSFRPILGPFRAKNLKTSKQDFPKKVVHVNFKLTCSCNLGKNQKNSECQFFMKLNKPLFGPISAPET